MTNVHTRGHARARAHTRSRTHHRSQWCPTSAAVSTCQSLLCLLLPRPSHTHAPTPFTQARTHTHARSRAHTHKLHRPHTPCPPPPVFLPTRPTICSTRIRVDTYACVYLRTKLQDKLSQELLPRPQDRRSISGAGGEGREAARAEPSDQSCSLFLVLSLFGRQVERERERARAIERASERER